MRILFRIALSVLLVPLHLLIPPLKKLLIIQRALIHFVIVKFHFHKRHPSQTRARDKV